MNKSKIDLLKAVENPELIFGLVGPIGTDLRAVEQIMVEHLATLNYEAAVYRITDILHELNHKYEIDNTDTETRYNSLINAGNGLREDFGRPEIFALLSTNIVRKMRRTLSDGKGRAYVLSQFKRPEEINAMRSIYGENFIQISVFASEQSRITNLTKRIAQDRYWARREEYYKSAAQALVARDFDEELEDYGQRLRDTFPLADVIIDGENRETAETDLWRFFRAFFGDLFVTPTPDEYGAYIAQSVALRSADLARQVGAAIFSPNNEVVSLGCNEVPKAGGGTYWEGDSNDARDFKRGYDSSAFTKRDYLHDLFSRLQRSGYLREGLGERAIPDLAKNALTSQVARLEDASFMDVLEFGRTIHAEMSAITDAARLGRQVKGATLYCTTFPCHNCARHIVAAGIRRVVYIEAYPKSQAAKLHSDALVVGSAGVETKDRVIFDAFTGIAPMRYEQIFKRGRRKYSDGTAKKFKPENAKPIINQFLQAHLEVESTIGENFSYILEQNGYLRSTKSSISSILSVGKNLVSSIGKKVRF